VGEGTITENDIRERIFGKKADLNMKAEHLNKEGRGLYTFTLTCDDRRGLLVRVLQILKEFEVNAKGINVKKYNERIILTISVEIENYAKTGKIIEKLYNELEGAYGFSAVDEAMKFLKDKGRREKVLVLAKDRTGLIADITCAMADLGINIVDFHAESQYVGVGEKEYAVIIDVPPPIDNETVKFALEEIKDVAVEFLESDDGNILEGLSKHEIVKESL
jgi:predicted amino acid-binding ACT domain protein